MSTAKRTGDGCNPHETTWSRRSFFSVAGWCAVLSSLGAGTLAWGRMMYPRVLFEEQMAFKVGFPSEQRRPTEPADPERLRVGAQLFSTLQCQTCHLLGDQVPEGSDPASLAPNLQRVPSRIRLHWLRRWLENPELLQPDTRMPSFWPEPFSRDPSPFAHVSAGTAQEDIAALIDYLARLEEVPPAPDQHVQAGR